MRIGRQPGRPTQQEFVAAAERLVANQYETKMELMVFQTSAHILGVPPEIQRQNDMGVAQREYDADGRVPGQSLVDFTLRQLRIYTDVVINNLYAEVDIIKVRAL